ncbi:DinB family protein [Lysinibacillus fusiformis]|uniref:DinB family protein n=1 Tax=Lysinibacillus TaxID=400634 RepID=UPI0019687C68|nr:DinB family protein [Lysinibacillus fusiformis]QSB09064.1 DinB family protein [Lysinibacillus fusiformis]
MSKKELLQNGVNQVFYEEEWYPPLSEALKNLTAAQACWQPEGNAANTIWENVNHLLIFKERLVSRLHKDDTFVAPQNNDETFVQGGAHDEDAWQETVTRTLQVHDALQSSLASLQEEALDQPSPALPVWQQYLNILLHDAYHTGQIVQLRKLQGSWPAKRSYL